MIFKFFPKRAASGVSRNTDIELRTHEKLVAIIADEIKKYLHDDRNIGAILLKIFSLRQIINSHGYKAGDNFLSSTMGTINTILKDRDSVYRVNDDELLIILPGILNEGHLILAANRISQLFENPIIIETKPIIIRVAMGAALFPELSDDAEDLLLKSSIALEEGIEKGLAYNVCPREDVRTLPSNLVVENQLREAIETNALEMHYQPKVDIKTRTVIGVEALARWKHPDHGLLPPNYFISLAEKTNLINDFTNTMLNSVLKEAREWRAIGADISVSVNLSAVNLQDDLLIDNIQRAINLWDISPGKLIFEISEGIFINNPEASMLAMRNINTLGACCSIDNFGAGNSALVYMKKMPIVELKIDKSFIGNILDDEGDKLLVDSIIHLAHNFRLKVIAEGVENVSILKEVERMNCDIVQGNHVAKPMPIAQFKQWMKNTSLAINPL